MLKNDLRGAEISHPALKLDVAGRTTQRLTLRGAERGPGRTGAQGNSLPSHEKRKAGRRRYPRGES